MARSWQEIQALPEFQALDARRQEGLRNKYFRHVVAPQVPTEELDAARANFDAETAPPVRNESFAGDIPDLVRKGLYNAAGGVLDFVGADTPAEWLYDQAKAQEQTLTPETVQALEQPLFSEEGDYYLGEGFTSPRAWLAQGLETLGGMALPIPGGALARAALRPWLGMGKAAQVAKGALMAEGVAERQAGRMAQRLAPDWRDTAATVAGYGGMEGLVSGGLAEQQTREQVLAMPQAQLEQAPVYWEALQQAGGDPQAARQLLAENLGKEAGWKTFGPTVALGAGAGRYYDKLIGGGGTGSRLKNMLQGGATETLEEVPQSAAETLAQNTTLQQVDPTIGTTDNLIPNMLTGAALGGTTGGVIAGLMPKGTLARAADAGGQAEGAGLPAQPGPTPEEQARQQQEQARQQQAAAQAQAKQQQVLAKQQQEAQRQQAEAQRQAVEQQQRDALAAQKAAQEAEKTRQAQLKTQKAAQDLANAGGVPPTSVTGLDTAFNGAAGAISENFFTGVFDALTQGKDTFAGVKDPILAKAKPFFAAGLIANPGELRALYESGFLDKGMSGWLDAAHASTKKPTPGQADRMLTDEADDELARRYADQEAEAALMGVPTAPRAGASEDSARAVVAAAGIGPAPGTDGATTGAGTPSAVAVPAVRPVRGDPRGPRPDEDVWADEPDLVDTVDQPDGTWHITRRPSKDGRWDLFTDVNPDGEEVNQEVWPRQAPGQDGGVVAPIATPPGPAPTETAPTAPPVTAPALPDVAPGATPSVTPPGAPPAQPKADEPAPKAKPQPLAAEVWWDTLDSYDRSKLNPAVKSWKRFAELPDNERQAIGVLFGQAMQKRIDAKAKRQKQLTGAGITALPALRERERRVKEQIEQNLGSRDEGYTEAATLEAQDPAQAAAVNAAVDRLFSLATAKGLGDIDGTVMRGQIAAGQVGLKPSAELGESLRKRYLKALRQAWFDQDYSTKEGLEKSTKLDEEYRRLTGKEDAMAALSRLREERDALRDQINDVLAEQYLLQQRGPQARKPLSPTTTENANGQEAMQGRGQAPDAGTPTALSGQAGTGVVKDDLTTSGAETGAGVVNQELTTEGAAVAGQPGAVTPVPAAGGPPADLVEVVDGYGNPYWVRQRDLDQPERALLPTYDRQGKAKDASKKLNRANIVADPQTVPRYRTRQALKQGGYQTRERVRTDEQEQALYGNGFRPVLLAEDGVWEFNPWEGIWAKPPKKQGAWGELRPARKGPEMPEQAGAAGIAPMVVPDQPATDQPAAQGEVPAGFTVSAVEQIPENSTSPRHLGRWGEWEAVVQRAKPWKSVRGYGQTREEAIANGVRLIDPKAVGSPSEIPNNSPTAAETTRPADQTDATSPPEKPDTSPAALVAAELEKTKQKMLRARRERKADREESLQRQLRAQRQHAFVAEEELVTKGYVETTAEFFPELPQRQQPAVAPANSPEKPDSSPDTRAGEATLEVETPQAPAAPASSPAATERPADWGANNTLVSRERAEELRKRLKAKLGQLNAGLDPEVLAIGTELAVFHIEAGVRRFADLARQLAADLDEPLERLRPYLRSWYNGARDMMEDSGLDVAGMDDPAQVRTELEQLFAPAETGPTATGARTPTETTNDNRGVRGGDSAPLEEVAPAEMEGAGGQRADGGRDHGGGADGQPGKDTADAGGVPGARGGRGGTPRVYPAETGAQAEDAAGQAAGQPGELGAGTPAGPGATAGAETGQAPAGGRTGGRRGSGGTRTGARAGTGTRGGRRRPSLTADTPQPTDALEPGDLGTARINGVPVAPPAIPARNFTISDELALGEGGQVRKYNDNVAAIRIVQALAAEKRRATPEEQAALARYVGWGGIHQAFPNPQTKEWAKGWQARGEALRDLLGGENSPDYRTARRSTQYAHYTSQAVVESMWTLAQRLGYRGGLMLESAAGVGNFLGLMPAGLRGDTRTVAVEMDGMSARILAALYPQAAAIHSPTNKLPIASNSFDLAIGNPPYHKTGVRWQYKPDLNRFSLHNQFVLADLDNLREDGLYVGVVTHYLLDAQDPAARLAMAAEAEFLGAIRLPNTAFEENALTEVVTDILVFRKHTRGEAARFELGKRTAEVERSKPNTQFTPEELEALSYYEQEIAWTGTTEVPDPLGGDPLTVGAWLAANPDMMLGTLERSGTMRAQGELTLKARPGVKIAEALAAAINRFSPLDTQRTDDAIAAAQARFATMAASLEIAARGDEPGAMRINADGALTQVLEREIPGGGVEMMQRTITADAPWSPRLLVDEAGRWFELVEKLDEQGNKVKQAVGKALRNVYERKTYASEAEVPASLRLGTTRYERLRSLVQLRDLLKQQIVLETQGAPEGTLETNRTQLRDAYEAYRAKHGLINEGKSAALVSEMPDGALVLALELGYKDGISAERAKRVGEKPRPPSARPAEILFRRVIVPYEPAQRAESVADALAVSLAETGRVDLKRIAALLGVMEAQAQQQLTEGDDSLAFFDPESQRLETRDAYLSGQVRRKLEAAKAAGLTANVKALEQVQPALWTAEQVTVKIGANWVPTDVWEAFFGHLTGGEARVTYHRLSNAFEVSFNGGEQRLNWDEWGVPSPDGGPRASAAELLTAMLNSKPLRLGTTDRDGIFHLDEAQTELAKLKMNQIAMEFADWIFADGARRQRLTALFNEKFNTRVNRQHDGSHLMFPGKVPDQIIRMRRSQKNAVWRGIVEKVLLLDHVVGAGKTFTGIARAMERKRLGLSKKPMIVVPNHLVESWAADVYRLYPGAKILAAGKADFERSRRRRLFAKIATGDWDIVIMPHSSFGKLGIAPETEERYLQQALEEAIAARDEAQAAADQENPGGRPRKPLGVKAAEALMQKIENRLDALRNKSRDNLLTFEELGVDDLTIDEAHEFKNLFYTSNLQGVRGMGDRSGSQKALDLYNKVRTLHENPNGAIAFMTGTPISNSAVELYTLMRYLAPAELQELGLEHFDAWRAQYVDSQTSWEMNDTARLQEVTRLGPNWSNMRSLMELYYSFSDAVTLDDLRQAYAEDNDGARFPVPDVKGGGRQTIKSDPTPAQAEILAEVVAGFNALPNEPDPDERNAQRLRLMDRARKVSLDARAVDGRLNTTEPGGKLEKATTEILRLYRQWDADRGTQLVFLDRSVPKSRQDAAVLRDYDRAAAAREAAIRANDEEALLAAEDALGRFDPLEMAALREAQAGGWNAYQQLKDNLVAQGIPANEIRFVQEANTDEQKKALFDAVNLGEVRVLIGSTARMGAGTNVQERLVGLHHLDVNWRPADIEQREGRIIRQGNSLLEKYGFDDFQIEILAYVTERTVDAKMWELNAKKLKNVNGIRKYNGEFEMEFSDEEAVSMAETAALASGDPLLLERVRLMAEIQKLELLERAHRRKSFAIEDRVSELERIIATYPKRIEAMKAEEGRARAELEQVREAATQRTVTVEGKPFTWEQKLAAFAAVDEAVAIQKDGKEHGRYSININGQNYTTKEGYTEAIDRALGDAGLFAVDLQGQTHGSRLMAARALAELINTRLGALEPGARESFRVGKMLGATLTVDLVQAGVPNFIGGGLSRGEVTLTLERDGVTLDHSYNSLSAGSPLAVQPVRESLNGLWQRMNDRALDGAKYMEQTLEGAKVELPEAQAKRGQPFVQAEELTGKRQRLVEVVRALSDDPQAAMAEGEQQAGTANEPRYSKPQQAIASAYELAGRQVSGLEVLDDIPNQGSIDASLADYTVLPGVRAVPMSAFPGASAADQFYASDDFRRVEKLAKEIEASGEIKPLIVVVDAEGPYVLEGGHRLSALYQLGVQSIPALVVVDNDGDARYSKAGRRAKGPRLAKPEAERLLARALGGKVAEVLLDSGIITLTNAGGRYQGVTWRDGTLFLNLDALTAGNFEGVLLHEGFHSAVRELLGETKYQELMGQLNKLLASPAGWVKEAKAAVPADTAAANLTEEVGAYAISQALAEAPLPNLLRRWAEGFMSALRAAIIRRLPAGRLKNWALANLKPMDLARLARAGLRAKARGGLRGAIAGGWQVEGARYMFVGPQANFAPWTNNLFDLNQAKERIAQGEDAELVRQETGWHEGRDGKWRFEISDKDARFTERGRAALDGKLGVGQGFMALDQALEHHALFAAYPALADYLVIFSDGNMGAVKGVIDTEAGVIRLDRKQPNVLSTLLHELQHGIQTIEGFALGSNLTLARQHPEYQRLMAEARKNQPAEPGGWGSVGTTTDDVGNNENQIALEVYRRSYGEQEARATEARMRMTAEQRRKTRPGLLDAENVIVTFNNKVAENAPMPANADPETFSPANPDLRFSLAPDSDAGGSPLGGGKALLDSVKQAMADQWTGKLGTSLGALTLRQLADVGSKWLPGIKLYDRVRLKMETRRNVMMEESGRLGDAVDSWARHRAHREEARAVFELMNDATLQQVDPAEYQVLKIPLQLGPGFDMQRNWEATEANVQELRRRVRAWKKSSNVRERELAGYYQIAARKLALAVKAENKRRAAYPDLLKRWEALSSGKQHLGANGQPFGSEQEARTAMVARRWPKGTAVIVEAVEGGWALQELGGQEVYLRFRDLYKQRSEEMLEALIKRLDSLESLDDVDKRALAAKIRAEFEAPIDEQGNPRIGPYFPLQRFGRFYVFARRFGAEGQRTFTRKDGEPFESAESARAALYKREDLKGVNARAVELEDGSGWVLEDQGEPGFWLFESVGDRRRAVAELEAEGWQVVRQGLTAEAHRELQGVSETFVADAVDKLKKQGSKDEADALYQMYLQTLQQMSIRKKFIHRKGTKGYTDDQLRAYGWNMTRLAHQISKLEGMPGMEKILRGLEQGLKEAVKEAPGMDTTRQDALLEEMKKRHEWIANPDNAPWTNAVAALGFLFYLGVSPAAALVNLSQVPIVALPVLAARLRGWARAGGTTVTADGRARTTVESYGPGGAWGEAGRALTTAFADVARGFKPGVLKGFITGRPLPSEAANLTAEERAAFAEWDKSGARDRTQAHNLAGIGDADSWLNGPTFNRVMGAISSLFHLAEVANRDATLLAAYRLARSRGISHEVATLQAEEATWEAHFDYSNANRARFMQPNVAKALLMFKNYAQHVLYFLGRNLYLWARGESQEVRQEARTKFAGMVGMTALFAGASGLPIGGAFVVANLVQALFGDDDEPWDAEVEWRNMLREVFPRDVADIIDRGAVNKLTGMDFASRVSIADLIYRAPDRDLDGAGMFQHVVEQLMGPVGGIAARPFSAYDDLREGHWGRAAEALAPKFLKDLGQMGRFGYEGVLSRKGDAIMAPGELSSYELFGKGLGFTPDDLAVRYDSNRAIKLYEGRIDARRRELILAAALAIIERDPEGLRAARQKIAAYNRAVPKYPISEATIRRSVRARQQMRERAEDGIIVNPKLAYLRDEAGGFGRREEEMAEE